jgi:diguanylate cyclase (GGDEF)-like protein/PAS domain S-box-containing protein
MSDDRLAPLPRGHQADVLPLRKGPEELVDDRYLLDAFLENTPDHVYFKDAQSRFLRVSASLASWLSLADPTEAIGRSDFDYFSDQHARKAFADEQLLMQTGQPVVAIEEEETWTDGRRTWVSTTKVPLRDRNGQVVGIFGISRDITERKQAEQRIQQQAAQLAEQAQKLEQLASLDELTGLYNRRGLTTVGEQLLYENRRTGVAIGVLFIDLDGLKAINDRHGHLAGDNALRQVAAIIKSVSRAEDVAARVGGDEFCLLLGNATADIVDSTARRIDTAVNEHNRDAHAQHAVSVSVGQIVVDARSPGSITDLIQDADASMYDRKARRASA